MARLRDTIITSSVYNSLPRIGESLDVPDRCAADLEILRALLAKHKVPDGVNVRLIHRHSDTQDGEAMAFGTVEVPSGVVQVMRPLMVKDYKNLRPIQYFVDDDRNLQAYEYTIDETPAVDLQDHESFLEEFCRTVAERGLERKFGLKIQDEGRFAGMNWSEYEIPSRRSTIIIPKGLPAPAEIEDSDGWSVMTEWPKNAPIGGPRQHVCQRHCNRHCRSHCRGHKKKIAVDGGEIDEAFTIGGQEVVAGTPFHRLVCAVVEAW